MTKVTFLLALALLLSSCKSGTVNAASAPDPARAVAAINDNSQKTPEFDLANIEGGTIKAADLQGKVVVLDFWQTDCAPCIEEIPDNNALYEKYKDKGVQFIGVTLESGAADEIKPAVKKFQIKYPVVVGNETVVESFGIIGTPTTFVLGKNGTIHHKYLGSPPGKKDSMEKDIQDLLALE